jgi:hypothetical protein
MDDDGRIHSDSAWPAERTECSGLLLRGVLRRAEWPKRATRLARGPNAEGKSLSRLYGGCWKILCAETFTN